MSEFAPYVNKFRFAANGNQQNIILFFYQEQPIWEDDPEQLANLESVEVGRFFMPFHLIKALADALNKCIKDHEGANTSSGE